MKTILLTAYAINPAKGSEDGMGWNFVLQAARQHNVIAVTRRNNRPHIERYQAEFPDPVYARIRFRYFDWPQWMLFWKKGPLISLLYFYLWQFTLALHIRRSGWQFDLAHNLNFHNDWTPTFLWLTGKPFVWGPVGHHPAIGRKYHAFYGVRSLLLDRLLWGIKWLSWHTDPFLWIARKKARHVLCMHREAAEVLRLAQEQYTLCPSVATEDAASGLAAEKEGFTLISAGRFVPLKGFDLTLRAFAAFYHALPEQERAGVHLHLIGSGPFEQKLKQLASALLPDTAVTWTRWMPREALLREFARASAFLFPSHEGAGMVVAEAMMHSLPVICWDNCGPGRFVPPASCLRVAPVQDPESAVIRFARNINALYQDRELWLRESILARHQYEKAFTWQSREDLLAAVYSQALP